MIRRRFILPLLPVAAAIGLGLSSWDVAVDRVERQLAGQIRSWSGLEVVSVERARIALLPLPRFKLSGVVFAGDGGRVTGRAPEVVARLRLPSLLTGRLGFDRVDLRGPEIELALPAEADTPRRWLDGIFDSLGRVNRDARIVVARGALFVRHGDAVGTIVRDINLVMNERSARDPVVVGGSLNWRGVLADVSADWPVAGSARPASLRMRSRLAEVAIDGERLDGPGARFKGRLRLESKSLPETIAWIGSSSELAGALASVTLDAEMETTAQAVSLTKAKLTLGADAFDGGLSIGFGGERWSIAGTLAGSSLDLAPFANRLYAGASPQAGQVSVSFQNWTSHDVDLRLSVEAARLGAARLTDVAAQLLVRTGRFEVALLRAGAYGGSVRGRLLAGPSSAGLDVKLQAGAERVSLAQAAAALPALARMTGTAAAQLTLEGVGGSALELRDAMTGKLSVGLRQGELAGFAFSDLMRGGDRSAARTNRDLRQGRSAYDAATLQAIVQGGSVFVQGASMTAPGWRVLLSGVGSLAQQRLDLKGALSGADGAAQLPITLTGPLDEPVLTIDPAAVLREPAAFTSPTR